MSDLNPDEQKNVRAALRFLHARARGWGPLADALGFKRRTMESVNQGQTVSATMAFRVAKLAGVSMEDLLTGKWPLPDVCPHCGRGPQGSK